MISQRHTEGKERREDQWQLFAPNVERASGLHLPS
jgi:hypothetical protein